MRLLLACCLLLTVIVAQAQDDAPYRDANLPVEDRVEDLLSRMTLDEKIGQMTLIEKNSIRPDDVAEYAIGGVLSGGGGYPSAGNNTPSAWGDMVTAYQDAALATRLGIPVIYGVDAVHGHNNLRGAVIYPHNIGLGATGDADLVRRIGEVTAYDIAATGIYWNYSPVLAVPQDYRWGRTYEGYSGDPVLVTELALAMMEGMQSAQLNVPTQVIGTPKHFAGDGGAMWGTGMNGQIDRGDTRGDETELRALHVTPYADLIDAGARSVMVSFSSWNGLKMHAHEELITGVLKGEMGFDGFVVSDWQAIDEIPGDYYSDVVTSINAGVDMNMVPYDYRTFITATRDAVNNGDISMERIDDAVRRILRVKFEMGLFENALPDTALIDQIGGEAQRALGREAVAKSLVLLQNRNNALPISREIDTLFVVGSAADDVGVQAGGWTIEWQGRAGSVTEGTTILDAVTAAVSDDTTIIRDRLARFRGANDADGNPIQGDVGLVVVGESPYAEMEGDTPNPALSTADLNLITRTRERVDTLIVVVISGRPIDLTGIHEHADAIVAAWLPGTEAGGIADVLFGDVPFTGKLPFAWQRHSGQLPLDVDSTEYATCDDPLYPFGYGLITDTPEADQIMPDAACQAG